MAVFSGNGAQATPSFTFSSDTDTGMFRFAGDKIGFSTGGTTAVVISDNQCLGVGIGSPAQKIATSSTDPTKDLFLASTGFGDIRMLANASTRPDPLMNLRTFVKSSGFTFTVKDCDSGANGGLITAWKGAGATSNDELPAPATDTKLFDVRNDGTTFSLTSVAVGEASPGVTTKLYAKNTTGDCALTLDTTSTGNNAFAKFSTGGVARGYIGGAGLAALSTTDLAIKTVRHLSICTNDVNTEKFRLHDDGRLSLYTNATSIDMLHPTSGGNWGTGIRIGHDGTYFAKIENNGNSNIDRQFLDFTTCNAGLPTLRVRFTDRVLCDITTISPLTSERRLKQAIDEEPINGSLAWAVVRDLPVRSFQYKNNPEVTGYGHIVDEVEVLDPSLIEDTDRTDDEGPLRTYNNEKLMAMRNIALQSALKRIEVLEAEIAALKG